MSDPREVEIDGFSLPLPLLMDLPVRVRVRGEWRPASMLPDGTVHAMVLDRDGGLVWMEWSPADVLACAVEVSLRSAGPPSWVRRTKPLRIGRRRHR